MLSLFRNVSKETSLNSRESYIYPKLWMHSQRTLYQSFSKSLSKRILTFHKLLSLIKNLRKEDSGSVVSLISYSKFLDFSYTALKYFVLITFLEISK